jgi:hypothetical protein
MAFESRIVGGLGPLVEPVVNPPRKNRLMYRRIDGLDWRNPLRN